MRSRVWALVAASAVVASCGGGGGGDEVPAPAAIPAPGGAGSASAKLSGTLTYPNDALALYRQVSIQPGFEGFQGHTLSCALRDGSLPPGLNLGSDCIISGRPLQEGSFSFKVRVGASGAANTLDMPAQLKVQAPLVQYPLRGYAQALALGDGMNDLPTFENWTAAPDLQASWIFRVASGSLPAGLSLDSASGRISGTVQEAGSFTAVIQSTLTTPFGTYAPLPSTFGVTVNVPVFGYTGGATDPANALDRTQRVYISQPVTLKPVMIGAAAPGTMIGNVQLQGVLPAGLSLDPATGVISGTPTEMTYGISEYDLQATLNSGGASTPTRGLLSLAVASPVYYRYAIAPPTFPVNAPMTFVPERMTPSGVALSPAHTVTFQRRADGCRLPREMTVDAASGTISGTPSATGEFSCVIDSTITNNGVTWTSGSSVVFYVR